MKIWQGLAGVVLALTFAGESRAGVCQGKFANPFTDICWSCIFPMTMGSSTILGQQQEDTPNPAGMACACANPPMIGIRSGFWEPVRRVDVTRTPYCFVSLGGVSLNPGIRSPEGEVRLQANNTKQSSWQAHWYVDPVMYYLEAVLDHPCMEQGSFDVAYMTEVDPTWNDDELTMLLNPETFLFGNPIAQAACAADCVLATVGFGSNTLFWCAGCNGSIYPFNGHVQAHVSLVQASSLVAQRMTAKLHREFLMWGTAGDGAMCGYYPQPVMDKTQYKYQMLYPIPQTEKTSAICDQSAQAAGSCVPTAGACGDANAAAGLCSQAAQDKARCCQPFGRSTAIWGAGKSFPYKGEDFAYEIFRKRNCCLGVGL